VGKVTRPRPAGYDGEPLLLDTHIWLWYLEGAERALTPAAVDLLRRANRAHQLLVSDISIWEIGTKVVKGRLRLALEVSTWVARAERAPGITFLPLDRPTLLFSTALPGKIHGDPADRMLVASALLQRCALVTADRTIISYARGAVPLTVIDARRRGAQS
jgi:PIN domain nuclease of toxin-antitoxin system